MSEVFDRQVHRHGKAEEAQQQGCYLRPARDGLYLAGQENYRPFAAVVTAGELQTAAGCSLVVLQIAAVK